MNKTTGAGANVDAQEGKSVANTEVRDSGMHDSTGSFAVFESLEALRAAPVEPEPASAEARHDSEEGNLQAVLNRYTDWLRTLDN